MQNILLFRLIKNFIEDENNKLEGLKKKKRIIRKWIKKNNKKIYA